MRIALAMLVSALVLIAGNRSFVALAEARGGAAGSSDLNRALQAVVESPRAEASIFNDDRLAFGIYRNTLPDDLSTVAAYEQATGKTMTIVHWYAIWGGWKGAFDVADFERVARRGSVPMVSWEPWDATPNDLDWSLQNGILSGRHDAYIEWWARGLAAYGKPVMLRFAHEMHDNWDYPWAIGKLGNTPEDYVDAWRRVHDIFERHGATNVAWVWSPNTLGTSPVWIHERTYRSLYPGDAYVDWVGLNIYNTGPNVNWLAPSWRALEDALTEPYEAITRLTDKPLVIGEVGSAETGGDKAQWIAEGLGPRLPARFPRLKAVVWFDITKEDAWTVQSSPAAYRAFIAALRQPHFLETASQFSVRRTARLPDRSAPPR